MARIIYSALATEIRGSIGGTTFQKNAYGFSVKNKPNMIKPLSPQQNFMKRLLLAEVQTWQGMSSTERTNWTTFANTYPQYAKHNAGSQLDGYGVFLRYNIQQQLYNEFIQTDPGVHLESLTPPTIELKSNGFDFSLAMTAPVPDTLINYNCFISHTTSTAVNYISSRTRYIFSDILRSHTTDIRVKYQNLFGSTPNVDDKVFVRIVFFDGFGAFVFAPVNYPTIVISF